jgi:hypothetical protein
MKKTKRSLELEDQEPGGSGKIGIELNKHDDDDIIDLDDIVELGDQSDDEDELDLGVELLDLEGDMDFKDLDAQAHSDDDFESKLLKNLPAGKAPLGKTAARAPSPLDEEDENMDLLKDFSFDDEESELVAGLGKAEAVGARKSGEEKDPLEGLLFAPEEESKVETTPKSSPPAPEKDILQKEIPQKVQRPVGPAVFDEEALLKEAGIALAGAGTGLAIAKMAETDDSPLDKVVGEIESRLVEVVKEMVEARLPDIVRRVLSEEIEKLKAELKASGSLL